LTIGHRDPGLQTRVFSENLESIANQSDRNFKVYIGDDAGHESLADIVREFMGKLPIEYKRFETISRGSLANIGTCIRMSLNHGYGSFPMTM